MKDKFNASIHWDQGASVRTDVVELLRGSVYDRLQRFSEETGIGIGEALNRAVNNYLNDEALIWREKAKKVKSKRK